MELPDRKHVLTCPGGTPRRVQITTNERSTDVGARHPEQLRDLTGRIGTGNRRRIGLNCGHRHRLLRRSIPLQRQPISRNTAMNGQELRLTRSQWRGIIGRLSEHRKELVHAQINSMRNQHSLQPLNQLRHTTMIRRITAFSSDGPASVQPSSAASPCNRIFCLGGGFSFIS
jgi:hypothetical protein